MNFILFDGPERKGLLPLTFTRPVADLRIGILKLKQKWAYLLKAPVSYHTEPYLQDLFPIKQSTDNVYINPAFLPTEALVHQILALAPKQGLYYKGNLLAFRAKEIPKTESLIEIKVQEDSLIHLQRPWHLFQYNDIAINQDFALLTKNRISEPLHSNNVLLGDPSKLFIEPGTKISCATLNTETGPIYIEKNATIQEGALIRGPFALCQGAQINMGAKIYGPTTIGPYSKVGGELNQVVIWGYSNKAHDGFLGHALIGAWCNLGAQTSNSNLKNDYSKVKMWSYLEQKYINTDLQFCGLIMGDHSKSAIQTAFNTGTVVGVFANIFGEGAFYNNHIPSFTWGAQQKIYLPEKALKVAKEVMLRRGMVISQAEENMLKAIFKKTTLK